MATGSRNATSDSRAAPRRKVLTYEQFVDDRLRKVRSYVKLRDLTAAMLLMVTGALAIVALLVIVDHWCFDLGFAGRLLGLGVLIGWLTFCIVARLVPPLFRSVNPAYAAKVIEEGEPSLKNRLLNFVLFRSHRSDLKEVVYQAVRQEAATELTNVEVESTVDYSRLVRFAAAMAALVIVLAIYSAFSPKSLFTTLSRILAPWRSIARPARVLIEDVQPGTTQAYFGRSVSVSALINRLPADQQPKVVFSSVDQRVVDERLTMSLDKQSDKYTTDLPPGRTGLRQDLVYRLEAGDAIAGPYRIRVVPAPSIVVERVEYDFPAYTQLSPEIVEGEGDISAMEGTRVTIHASTNQVISSAYLEFDADKSSARPGRSSRRARKTIPIDHEGQTARVSFTLLLREDGRTPVHSSYQLRFHNQQNEVNSHPIRYHINVLPDLKPEVEILTPTQTVVNVPVNATQPIEVRAFDPDFRLSELALQTVQLGGGGKRIKTIDLLDGPATGQVTKRHLVVPEALGLHPGQTVVVRAMAADNRHDPNTRKPKPNTAQTGDYRLRIVEPAAPDPKNQASEQDRQPSQDPQSGTRSDESSDETERREGEEGERQGGESGAPSNGGTQGGTDSPQDGEPSEESGRGSSEGSSRTSESGSEGASDSSDSSGSSEGQQAGQTGDRGESDAAENGTAGADSGGEGMDQRGGSPEDNQGDNRLGGQRDGRGDDQREAAGTGQTDDPSDEGERESVGGDLQSNGRQRDDTSQGQQESREGIPAEEDKPLPSDGSQDADVFDRVMEQMRNSDAEEKDSAGAQPEQGSEETPSEEAPSEELQSRDKTGDESDRQSAQRSEGTDPASTPDPAEEETQQDPNQAGSDSATDQRADAEERTEQRQQPGQGQPGQDTSEQRSGQPSPTEQPQSAESSNQTGGQDGEEAEQTPNAQPSRQSSDQQGEQGERQGGTSQGQSGQGQQGSGSQSGREPGGAENAAGAESGEPGQTGDGQSSFGQQGQEGTADEESSSPGQSSPDGERMGDRSGRSESETDETSDETGNGSKADGTERRSSTDGEPSEDAQGSSTASPDGQTEGDAQETPGETPSQQPSEPSSDRDASESGTPEQPGQRPGQQPGSEDGSQSSDEAPQQGESTGETPGQGGAERGNQEPPPSRANNLPEPGGDAANLEYSKKATKMVLEYLKDQRDEPDPELLERLGWSREDLNRFIHRWEQMQQAARQPGKTGQEARRELDQALRSLGLQPPQDSTQAATDSGDSLTDISDAGTRGRPPAQYRDAYKAFMQRRNKTDDKP